MAEEKKTLGFEITPTSYMVFSHFYPKENKWGPPMLRYREDPSLWPSPMSAGLNYGLAVFEGMKAFRHKSGEIFIFRPEEHAKRFKRSLKGLSMPEFPESIFLDALQMLVKYNAKFVPEYRQGSLYIRPIAWGNDRLGFAFHPDLAYTAAFWCSPVGNYYAEGLKPISVYVIREMTRAMPGGLGHCKAAGNYEISRMAKIIAEKNSCNESIFLDGKTKKHIEELGAANVFIVKNDALYAPPLRDTILSGITRRSIMTLAEEELGLEVCEEDIFVKKHWWQFFRQTLREADEIFACGTAAIITPIGRIKDGETPYTIGDGQPGEITKKLYDLLTGIQYGDAEDSFGWLKKVNV